MFVKKANHTKGEPEHQGRVRKAGDIKTHRRGKSSKKGKRGDTETEKGWTKGRWGRGKKGRQNENLEN